MEKIYVIFPFYFHFFIDCFNLFVYRCCIYWNSCEGRMDRLCFHSLSIFMFSVINKHLKQF